MTDVNQFRWILRFGLIATFVWFAGMIIQIETVNRWARLAYHKAEARMRRESPPAAEHWLRSVVRGWAATWPLLAGLSLTVMLVLWVGLIKG